MFLIAPTVVEQKEQRCIKIRATIEQQKAVDLAYKVSGGDKEFLALIEAENGQWTYDRKSIVVGANGYRDRGLCQINPGFHPEIYNDKRFSDPQWQTEQCYKLYSQGTVFYGKAKIKHTLNHFICK